MALTTSEWQLQNREVLWEGSRIQNCELMNKNIIEGVGWKVSRAGLRIVDSQTAQVLIQIYIS